MAEPVREREWDRKVDRSGKRKFRRRYRHVRPRGIRGIPASKENSGPVGTRARSP